MSPVYSSAAGESKNPMSHAKSAKYAEKSQKQKSWQKGIFLVILSFSVSSVCSSAAGERKKPLSHAKSAKYAETAQK